ncbi:hypothetical protein ACVWWI_002808 [Bradyrhizobium sp. USDA 3686]|uniref:hypothetical protein n=1 Tax=Bradyrhizobium TaxID=374 RepID=UPI00195C991E|nr:hypothetical protein [Bradyrhizobium canariense]MBM7483874.1 hypothetical protein [Bradyrhizobium canariense]UFW74916.1 hypothetical protein BcanWU425_14610 [Bradyrhizobium canariense]
MIESRTPRLYELLHAYGAAKFKDGRHPKRSSASAGRPPLAYGVLLDEDADFFVSEMRFRLTSSSIAFGSRDIDSPPEGDAVRRPEVADRMPQAGAGPGHPP